MKKLRCVGMIFSCILGLELVAVIYFLLGINPIYVPLVAEITLWFTMSVIVACVVDEIIKVKFKTRLISKNLRKRFTLS